LVKRRIKRQNFIINQATLENIAKLKETILKEYPRLTEDETFHFECGPHLDCYNDCCADVNIFLTPYDVLRMRHSLKLGSSEFLNKYTIIPFDEKQNLPVPLMLMREDETKECHFVDEKIGCTIYKDRPWPCRMYPVGLASPGEKSGENIDRFYFFMREDHCHGFERPTKWTIKEWMDDQGVGKYDEFGEVFKDVTIHKRFANGWKPTPKHIEIYWMALYDLDKFYKMVLESTFLERFELTGEEVQDIKEDDEALLRLGFRWVKMALFGEQTIPIRAEAKDKVALANRANG